MNIYVKLILALVVGLGVGFGGFLIDKKELPEVSIAKGKAFLEENAKKENVVTTASGLQYEVLTKGIGGSPSATSRVTVHYKGTTIDGEEFDSSYSRSKPTSFPLDQVIKGWSEGIQLMNNGSKYRFFIPYDLAYGEKGAPGVIEPYATLIFEVELLNF